MEPRGRQPATREPPLPTLLVLVAVIVACRPTGTDAAARRPERTVHVLAAASLTEAFGAMGREFSQRHPGVDADFHFAASSALAHQIDAGAPGDVFVGADESTMRTVVDAGHAADPTVMARNELTILVEKGNPKAIRGLTDLVRPDVVLVLCSPEVPCGRLAAAALDRAGVRARPASTEENVKAVASRVVLGEADAGIVYRTDAISATDRAQHVTIDIAGEPGLRSAYPIAVLTGATNPAGAREWVRFALSEEGQAILGRFGFLPP